MPRKVLIVLVAIATGGCSAYVPIAELEDEAMQTGDWSTVEEREKSVARREASKPVDCGTGQVEYCSGPPGLEQCHCVQRKTLRKVLPHGM